MPTLYVNCTNPDCPKASGPINTGMDLPRSMDLSGFTNNTTVCPDCGETVTWNGSDAFFLDE